MRWLSFLVAFSWTSRRALWLRAPCGKARAVVMQRAMVTRRRPDAQHVQGTRMPACVMWRACGEHVASMYTMHTLPGGLAPKKWAAAAKAAGRGGGGGHSRTRHLSIEREGGVLGAQVGVELAQALRWHAQYGSMRCTSASSASAPCSACRHAFVTALWVSACAHALARTEQRQRHVHTNSDPHPPCALYFSISRAISVVLSNQLAGN